MVFLFLNIKAPPLGGVQSSLARAWAAWGKGQAPYSDSRKISAQAELKIREAVFDEDSRCDDFSEGARFYFNSPSSEKLSAHRNLPAALL